MEFTFLSEFDAVVIDNFYTEDQLKELNLELEFLTKPSIMTSDHKSLLSAVDDNGKYRASKNGIWVDTVFRDWKHSSLISCLMKNSFSEELKSTLLKNNSLYRVLFHCDSRAHLLSYYENSDYYGPHTDRAVFTILSYFCKEPKMFNGGTIKLHSLDNSKKADVEVKNNRVIIIPSCVIHEVDQIVMESKELTGNGRYCCAAFLTMSDEERK